MNDKKRMTIELILLFIGVIAIFFSPFLLINIKLIGNKEMKLDYGEKYSEPGYKASVLNFDITDKVKIKNNIKKNIGKYNVTYSYQVFCFIIKQTRTIEVGDLTGPKITLKGPNEISITLNSNYIEPGFEAIDKVDGNVTKKVKTTNNIDNKKQGEYEVIYEVKDKAGNKTKITRKVKVDKPKPIHMSIETFSLDGWYDSVKLKETKDYGDDYYNNIVLIGDSNTMHMYQEGILKGNNAWAVPCLHAESMFNTELNIYGTGEQILLLNAIEKYKPNMIILNFGTFSASWISEEVFLDKANTMIKSIKEKSPNTKIIITSLYPIGKGYNINNFKQEVINRYNFFLLEMADKYKLKYLDVEEALKGQDGYGKSEYYTSDNFHLTTLGYNKIKEYIKTHAWEEN